MNTQIVKIVKILEEIHAEIVSTREREDARKNFLNVILPAFMEKAVEMNLVNLKSADAIIKAMK